MGGGGGGGGGAELAKKNVLKKHPAENGVCAKDQTTALPIPKRIRLTFSPFYERIRLQLSPFQRGSGYPSPHCTRNQITTIPIPEIILQFCPFYNSVEVQHITLGPFRIGQDHNFLCSTGEQTITLSAFHSGSHHNPIRVPLRIRA